MIDKKRSASSKYWLREYLNDTYVQESKKKGLRSRAWFKIKEIQQIDKIFKPGMTVIDLGSTPGSWSQYVIKQIGLNGHIIACDLIPMVPIDGVDFFQGNFCDEIILKALLNYIGDKKVHVIMSDMSPNISGISTIDIARSMYLVESALDMCHKVLTLNGSFIVKVFHGNELNNFLKKIHYFFVKVKIRKPAASRSRSREVYIVATGYKV